MTEASSWSPEHLISVPYTPEATKALALRLREVFSGLNGTAPSATAILNNNDKKNTTTDNSTGNLMTPPNGWHIPDIGVPSPTASIENPATLTAHTSGGSSQHLQQEQDLAKTTTTAAAADVAVNTKATTSPPPPQPPSPAAASTSRLATLEAAGVSLGGRSAAQGGPSKYRGVVWHKSNSKWEARIYEAGKQRFLGYFSNEDEAALTYDDCAARIHGTSAKLNFPDTYAGVVLPRPAHAAAHAVKQHIPSGTRSVAAAAAAGGAAGSRPRSTTTAAAAAHIKVEAASQAAGGAFTHHQAHPRRGGSGGMRVLPVKGSSSFRGVSWNSNCHKWRAQLWKGAEVHHLGYFEREEDAAHAYDQALLRIRGPNAPTNYPRSHYGVYSEDEVGEEDGKDGATSNTGFQSSAQCIEGKPGGRAYYNSNSNNKVYKDARQDSSSSNMLGVSWSESHKSWISEIWDGKEYQLLGTFTTEAEAAKAYDVACLAQHGSDALTNFSVENYPSESAAVTLLEISHDLHGYEELYGDNGGRDSRSMTPPALASVGGSSRRKMLHQQQHQYHSSNDLSGLTNSKTATPRRQTVVVHNPTVNGAGAGGKRRAVTPAPGPQKENSEDGGSVRFPWDRQQRASTPPVSFGAPPVPLDTLVPEAAAPPPVVNVEEFGALYGRLQNFIAHYQQRQTLPVLPLQSSAPRASGEAPQQQQQQQPGVSCEHAHHALMAIMQAALARQQQQQQQEAAAAAAAAAAAREQYASQQRLAVTAAIQNWAIARQQQQIHVVPAPAAISLKRDFSNFSSAGNSSGADAMAAACRALLAHHQMNAAAAKRPRV
ncbi:hypothetical protein Ndes2526B_g05222 [Nannochloris sp. 'desiccata']